MHDVEQMLSELRAANDNAALAANDNAATAANNNAALAANYLHISP